MLSHSSLDTDQAVHGPLVFIYVTVSCWLVAWTVQLSDNKQSRRIEIILFVYYCSSYTSWCCRFDTLPLSRSIPQVNSTLQSKVERCQNQQANKLLQNEMSFQYIFHFSPGPPTRTWLTQQLLRNGASLLDNGHNRIMMDQALYFTVIYWVCVCVCVLCSFALSHLQFFICNCYSAHPHRRIYKSFANNSFSVTVSHYLHWCKWNTLDELIQNTALKLLSVEVKKG